MEKLNVAIILEVLGRPAENVKDALVKLVEKLSTEKGVKITSKKINEPKALNEGDLYTSFAELELELDSLYNYFGILFSYMPSHIEMIYPSKINLTNFELSTLANQLAQRLHSYDAVAKSLVVERDRMAKKLMEVAPHLFQQKQPQHTQVKSAKKGKSKKAVKKVKTKKK